MENKPSVESLAAPGALLQNLAEMREALLRLHKALVESERAGYEKIFGRIASPYQFWQLLTDDPWFAWLRPVSQLVAAMDEILDAQEPLQSAAAKKLTGRIRTLLVAESGGKGFSGHYDEALQRDPDVLFAHVQVTRAMSRMTGHF